MAKKSLSQNRKHLKNFGEFQGYEATEKVSRHLQINIDKPCTALYLDGKIWPQPGERSIRFYALAAELNRMGVNEETALNRLTDYYNRIPQEITQAPGQDNRAFTLHEAETAIKSAYRGEIKSYGCNSPIWSPVCSGKELCLFHQQISGKQPQSPQAAQMAFMSHWMGKDNAGKKIMPDSDFRVYIAIEFIEKKRRYKPGSLLFISWRELSDRSGISESKIGISLESLHMHGLIIYHKGKAKERGTASEIRRVIPVPKPSDPIPLGTVYPTGRR